MKSKNIPSEIFSLDVCTTCTGNNSDICLKGLNMAYVPILVFSWDKINCLLSSW